MKLKIGDSLVKLIGDVHLGRRFINGVPLHRRGEREKMVWDHFVRELHDVEGCDYCIQVGDIFDRTVVPNALVLETYQAIGEASDMHDAAYIFIKGNHDASRDTSIRSSFDVLATLARGIADFVSDEPEIYRNSIAVVPWHPFHTAEEMVSKLPPSKFDAIIGHWDIESFGGNDDNLLPYEVLMDLTDTVITGHVHQPQEFIHSTGLKVIVTGSMEPYTFAEDIDGKLYKTMTLSQFESTDPTTLRDKYVRVVIAHDANEPEPIDCLGWQVKRLGEDEQSLDVQFETFEFDRVFREVFREAGVSTEVTESYLSIYHESR